MRPAETRLAWEPVIGWGNDKGRKSLFYQDLRPYLCSEGDGNRTRNHRIDRAQDWDAGDGVWWPIGTDAPVGENRSRRDSGVSKRAG
jgi:hypothetical protein